MPPKRAKKTTQLPAPITEPIPIHSITLGKEIRAPSSASLRPTNYPSPPLPMTSDVTNKEYIEEKGEDNEEEEEDDDNGGRLL